MEDFENFFSEHDLAELLPPNTQASDEYIFEAMGPLQSLFEGLSDDEQPLDVANDNWQAVDCHEGMAVENTDGDIKVYREVVEREEKSKENDDEDEEDKEKKDEDYVPKMDDGESSYYGSARDDSEDGENVEPLPNDEDDTEPTSNIGPYRKQKRLKLDEIDFEQKALRDDLVRCHKLNVEIGKKYSKKAVVELAKLIRASGAGNGSDYAHFYIPFDAKYPALINNFTIYCIREQEKKIAADLKSSYFRTALKNHLSHVRQYKNVESDIKRLKAGVLSHAKIALVYKKAPVRGNEPCSAAIDDFKSDQKSEVIEWIREFSRRSAQLEKDGFESSLFHPNGALSDYKWIRMELELWMGCKKFGIFESNAGKFLSQCVKADGKYSGFESLKRTVVRMDTITPRQETIQFVEENGENDGGTASRSHFPIMRVVESVGSDEGFLAFVYIGNVCIRGTSSFTAALIALVGLFRISNIRFPVTSNQLLLFLTDFLFGCVDVVNVYRRTGRLHKLSQLRRRHFITMVKKH